MNALAAAVADAELYVEGSDFGTSRRNNKPWHRPIKSVYASIDKRRRSVLLEKHPGLRAVWEAEAALAAAQKARTDALKAANAQGVSLRVLAEYGADGGVPLPESKSALGRLLKEEESDVIEF